jgi:hypothetical protein
MEDLLCYITVTKETWLHGERAFRKLSTYLCTIIHCVCLREKKEKEKEKYKEEERAR